MERVSARMRQQAQTPVLRHHLRRLLLLLPPLLLPPPPLLLLFMCYTYFSRFIVRGGKDGDGLVLKLFVPAENR